MNKRFYVIASSMLIINSTVTSPVSASEGFSAIQTLTVPTVSILESHNQFNRLSVKIIETMPELKESNRKFAFSPTQLKTILEKAGFKGDALRTAWAVAMKESTGRPYALNRSSNCYGLFQINMTGSMGPDRRKKYGLESNRDLFDPLTNAKIAYQMSNGGKNWSGWSDGMSKVPAFKLQFPE